jgi:hypothetical protein
VTVPIFPIKRETNNGDCPHFCFLKNAAESVSDIFTPIGVGTGINITGKSVVGSVLADDEYIVHASIFSKVV